MIGIMGPWTGFWVVLNPKDGLVAMCDSRNRSVIEVEVRDLDGLSSQRIGIQCEAMVLTGDLHLARGAAGVIEAAMAIGELERLPPHGKTEDLVSKADPEQR